MAYRNPKLAPFLLLLPILAAQAGGSPQNPVAQRAPAHAPWLPNPRVPLLPECPPAAPTCGASACGCGSLAPTNGLGSVSDQLPVIGGGPLSDLPGVPGVHLASGEFHLVRVDLRIPGRGFDFVWARRYASRDDASGALGHGWDFSYNVFVVADGADLVLADGNGRRDRYELQPDGGYVARGIARRGRVLANGTLEFTFPDQGKWEFHPLAAGAIGGKLERIVDRNGNTMVLGYAPNGNLGTVTDTLGQVVTLSYDGANRITAVTDFAGRSVVYEYHDGTTPLGSAGDLASARSPVVTGTPTGNDFPNGKLESYTYSKGFAPPELNHNLLTVVDALGRTVVANAYSPASTVGGELADRLRSTERGSPAEKTKITYFPSGLLPILWPLDMLAIVNDPVGNVAHFTYDGSGRLLAHRQYTGRADPSSPTTTTGNRPQNPLRPDDPPWFETRWEWNDELRPTRIDRPSGAAVEYVWGADIDPDVPLSKGNLLERRRLRGTHPEAGDQPELLDLYEYEQPANGHGSDRLARHTGPGTGVTEFSRDAAGNVTLVRHSIPSVTEAWEYNAFGQPTAHVLPDDGAGWLRRDEFTWYATGPMRGRLEKRIVDAAALALTTIYQYDPLGRVVREIDPAGFDELRVYNQLGQLVRVRSKEPVLGSGIRYERDYRYDERDDLVRLDVQNKDAQGNLAPNAYFTTRYEYDSLHRRIRTRTEVNPTHEIVEELVYDAKGLLAVVRKGEAVNGSQPGNTITSLFDERDLPFRTVHGAGSAAEVVQIDYDADGNQKRIVKGTGNQEVAATWVADAFGRPIRSVDSMGNVRTTHWKPEGRRSTERLEGELVDVPGGTGNVRLSESSFSYDPMGRTIESVSEHFLPATQAPVGDGSVRRTTTYGGTGQVLTRADDHGHVETSAYDTAGRRISRTDALGNVDLRSYDARGRWLTESHQHVSGVTGASSTSTTHMSYDGLGRLTSVLEPSGALRRREYGSHDEPTATYDPRFGAGQVGNKTITEYDGAGRVVRVRRVMTDSGTGDGLVVGEIVTENQWDDSSRLVEQIDSNGNATQYTYDEADRLVATRLPDGSTLLYTYDSRGNLIGSVDANGTSVTLSYDAADRHVSSQVAPGPGVAPTTTFESFGYDGRGQLVSALDDDSVVTKSWDSRRSLVAEAIGGRVVTAAIDGEHGLVGLALPGGQTFAYAPDALHRIATVSDAGGIVASLEYDGPFLLERVDYDNGTRSDYAYDSFSRSVGSRSYHVASNANLRWSSFSYDVSDDLVGETELDSGVTRSWSYDSAGRLESSVLTPPQGQVIETGYLLDEVGNRVSVTGGGNPGSYGMDPTTPEPADRQMNQYTTTPGAARTYDANGNLRSVDDAAPGTWTYQYDYKNRLISAQDSGSGLTATYVYDALGRKVERTVASGGPAVVRRYSYFQGEIVEAQDETGATKAVFLWAPAHYAARAADHLLRATLYGGGPPAELYYHVSKHGDVESVAAVSDALGNVVERYRYGDFGQPVFLSPSGQVLPVSAVGNDTLFHSRRWDPAVRLYDFRARWYDPAIGRFVSRDPIGVWGDADNLGNPYSIVGNNPRTYADSTGLYKDIDEVLDTCSSSDWSRITYAAEKAEDMSQDSEDHLSAHSTSGRDDCPYYAEWFGDYSSTRYKFVMDDGFDGVNDIFDTETVYFSCVGDCVTLTWSASEGVHEVVTNAYVYSGGPAWIHVCANFFTYSSTDRGLIIVHELAHEADSKIVDYAYGADDCRDLADEDPNDARKNADNYELFTGDM